MNPLPPQIMIFMDQLYQYWDHIAHDSGCNGIITVTMVLNRKHILSWTLFDFANSSYSAVIATVVFPVYYANSIVGNSAGLGDLWWGRAISSAWRLWP